MKLRLLFSPTVAALLAALTITGAAPSSAHAMPPKRAVPDYDGKGGEPTSADDVLLWIPRVILSPLYFVSEFLVRRPLGAIISAAEKANLPDVLYDFFAFGPDHKAGIAPYALIDFGFKPSVGIYAFWNDAGFKGHDLVLHAATWGPDWLAGGLTERFRFGDPKEASSFSFNAVGIRRPDYVFYGLGPRTLQHSESRYSSDSLDGNVALDLAVWRATRLNAAVGMRSVSFSDGASDQGDPTLITQVGHDIFPVPPGFARGYTIEYNQVGVAFDNRLPRPKPGSGIRLELNGLQGNDVRQNPGSGFVRYGATAGGFYDLNDHGRVVSLSVAAQFADPLGKEPVPFTELVSLGGYDYMRGFFPGRLIDRSAAVATLKYRWPIWAFIDGSIQIATGNVFGIHLDELEPKLLRLSGAIGIETLGSPDNSVNLLFGAGTETIEHGMQIDTFRIVAGTNRGF
ncbi:MAG: BamA/TamA family outer membrane protein [Polyangiaceae bacterium]